VTASERAEPISDLEGQVALVTGASRTLGAAIARALARCGAAVAVNYNQSEDAARELCGKIVEAGGQAVPIQADVTEPGDIPRLIQETVAALGPVDVLVNNVGPYVDTPFLDLSTPDFHRVLSGNLRPTFTLSQILGRSMKERGSGRIINIAATDAFHRSHSIYGLAKQAVLNLTEAMALDLVPEVTVNAIAPDLIADNEDMSEELAASAIAATPMGKLITRAEIADMACLICGPVFANVTGQTVVMDGGRSIRRMAGA
jgi:NAD(P)-dependent dehydrogenase (short-subunit alcohol dehydrogenase family)